MKKLIFTIAIVLLTLASNSQTTHVAEIKNKLDNAPKNEYGVQRIDYGIWDSTDTHIWAYHTEKEGYVVCVLYPNKEFAVTTINDCKPLASEMLDADKWIAKEW